ncbi:Hypothethical protein (fragment) [Cupriavidus neocaledonicus]|uniref:Hypothethical protein n=2 Tax=Cupriavidus neocaledonicus TaxID=1040979 RepID=A0A375H4W4_9BURK
MIGNWPYLGRTPEFTECNDGWYLAARDIWRGLVHYRDDETGTTLFETQSPEDLTSTALDDLQNYRLFRYLGAVAPASLEEAYKQTSQLSFFPPTHVWLGGKFIDIGEVSEIRVDGQVALSTTLGFTGLPPDDKRTRFEK